ncbi:hypothetical protein [Natrinema longum]|uniref:Uncharacterized protein n=1 Tax=Natrinema longum TaxID=370324 RepID=A0A8A2U9Q9_9EURY|nr:hypothetical protein [Natrinema longum]MBZ6496578.1 hypothetical protein [Natrinema longum]QSW85521.1 hypothetical protein J0X27_01355 [Natrinema longum]
MSEGDEDETVMAACTACESVFAAKETANGTILPIGRPQGCQCGSTDFEPVTTPDDRLSKRASD